MHCPEELLPQATTEVPAAVPAPPPVEPLPLSAACVPGEERRRGAPRRRARRRARQAARGAILTVLPLRETMTLARPNLPSPFSAIPLTPHLSRGDPRFRRPYVHLRFPGEPASGRFLSPRGGNSFFLLPESPYCARLDFEWVFLTPFRNRPVPFDTSDNYRFHPPCCLEFSLFPLVYLSRISLSPLRSSPARLSWYRLPSPCCLEAPFFTPPSSRNFPFPNKTLLAKGEPRPGPPGEAGERSPPPGAFRARRLLPHAPFAPRPRGRSKWKNAGRVKKRSEELNVAGRWIPSRSSRN